MKKFIKEHIIGATVSILIMALLIIVATIFIIRYYNLASWEAISAVGEWGSILVAVLIPIAIIYLEKQVEKNSNEIQEKKEEIQDSNLTLYDEINSLKKTILDLNNDSINEKIQQELKSKIYKFICISMTATTEDIMKKFEIDFDTAKDVLLELSRVDNLIVPLSLSDNPENENCNWSRKRYMKRS